jgi:hypothetical protein
MAGLARAREHHAAASLLLHTLPKAGLTPDTEALHTTAVLCVDVGDVAFAVQLLEQAKTKLHVHCAPHTWDGVRAALPEDRQDLIERMQAIKPPAAT